MELTPRTAFPPQPTVEHLVTVFRRIESGSIIIPAFQRTFVWGRAQILELLESVVNGFPIGSVLLWRSEADALKRSDSVDIPFPRKTINYPVYYVLDGLQRLSTLYGVFHFGTTTTNRNFDVAYDLDILEFRHRDELESGLVSLVRLSSLFSPRALLDVQSKLLKSPHADRYIERLLWLQGRFQDYMLPIVTISEKDVEDVVKIFERVNSTGLRLSRVDFMRAITWSSAFDLGHAIEEIQSRLEETEFELQDDSIVKCLALKLGLEPEAESLLKLREFSPHRLSGAVDETWEDLRRTIGFFHDEMNLYSSSFIPYEGQILAVFNHFNKLGTLPRRTMEMLKAWVLASSFVEILQGRPDHYVARMIRKAGDAAFFDDIPHWVERAEKEPIGHRRLIRGKALSAAFVMLLVCGRARSITSGEVIEVQEYTRDFDSSLFMPVIGLKKLQKWQGEGIYSAKTVGNSLLCPPGDRAVMRGVSSLEAFIRSMHHDRR
jgi:Protein of unknown function DUF262